VSENPAASNAQHRQSESALRPVAGSPMRILMITQFYPPVIGGIEVHVQALARGLVERGHEVAVATFATPEHPTGVRLDGGVSVHALQGTLQRFGSVFASERRHAIPLPDPESLLALRRIVAEFRPDVVHAHNWLGRSYLPLARGVGVPYLVSLHDSSRICTQARWMYRDEVFCTGPSVARCTRCCRAHFGGLKGPLTYFGNRLARRAEADRVDLFLPVSRAVAGSNRLAEDGLPFEVVPNFSVDIGLSPAIDDPRLAQLPEEPYLLFAGDVVADKGADALLEAYRQMTGAPPLVLIGRISDATRAALPPGAIAIGAWPHELVSEAWRRCLLGVVPSIFLDPCPTTAYEAMAAGKAVVASARGGLLDQVDDDVTGLLVTPGDPSALADAIARLVSDRELRDRMGAAGRERFLERFESGVIITRIESLYRARVDG